MHANPQFNRDSYMLLDGEWTYEFDFVESGRHEGRDLKSSKGFANKIRVPFCPESALSGVGHKDFIPALWYHKKVDCKALGAKRGERVIIHFLGVDYESEVYINGVSVGAHFGGSAPFEFDITAYLADFDSPFDLVVRVRDTQNAAEIVAAKPIGKQSYNYLSFGCAYTRTTGIWQSVWLEAVHPCALRSVQIISDFERAEFRILPTFYSQACGLDFRVKNLPQTIDRPWSPEDPFLYNFDIETILSNGEVVDTVHTYAGLRKVHCEGDRIFLNNKPIYLRFVLDQGFYPDGIWTAPNEEALKRDIELSMAAGFNGARLHQKIFDPKFHYFADTLGYLTWAEFPSWGCAPSHPQGFGRFADEWRAVVERDRNHPSIIAWTPFNEAHVLPPTDRDIDPLLQHRFTVAAIYDLTHALDPTRPVNDASGWVHAKTDLWTTHNYARANELAENLKQEPVFVHERFKNQEIPYSGQPYFIDEFGGIRWTPENAATPEELGGFLAQPAWGYGEQIGSAEEVISAIAAEVEVILAHPKIRGYCYTQLTDVEQEQNGIYTYDRKPKFSAEKLKAIFGKNPE